MTEKAYAEATKLRKSIKVLEDVNRALSYSYPEINIGYGNKNINVPYSSLDETTGMEIKDALTSVVQKRLSELKTEFDQL